jgi:xanthine/CO dehydrogenase XdhC/CoxF family maturation factor
MYAPAGLDIGADTPEAIALSIAAEIQSVLKARGGGHLRDRKGSIYDRK